MLLRIISLLLLAIPTILWFAAGSLIAPVNHKLPPAPTGFTAVQIGTIHGWYQTHEQAKACVLLLHGIRSDRSSMLARASFLHQAGYSTLLIDLQAHGESIGENISFGYRESDNVHAALDFLKPRCRKTAIIGVSLGGAASLLGKQPAAADALILESVYPSIEQAVHNRLEMRIGWLAKLISPLFYQQIPLRLNIALDELKPIQAIKQVKVPVFIIGGMLDQHTSASETQQLHAAARTTKQLWLIPHAIHQDFHAFAKAQYQQRVLQFLAEQLQ